MEDKFNTHQKPLLHIALIGDTLSGKSNIASRLSGKPFSEEKKTTIGTDYFSAIIKGEKILIYDYGCSLNREMEVFQNFNGVESPAKKTVNAVGLVVDGSKEFDVNAFTGWLTFAMRIKAEKEKLLIFILLSKNDLTEPIQTKAIESSIEQIFQKTFKTVFPKKNNPFKLPIFSCSAKDNKGISETFTEIVNECVRIQQTSFNSPFVNKLEPFNKKFFGTISPFRIILIISLFLLMFTIISAIFAIFPPGASLAFGLLFPGAGSLMAISIGLAALLLINIGYKLISYIHAKYYTNPVISTIEDNPHTGEIENLSANENNKNKANPANSLYIPENNPQSHLSEEMPEINDYPKFCIFL